MCAELRRRWLWIERVLLGTGIVCLVWWGVVSLQATRYQSEQRAALERMRVSERLPWSNASAALPTGSVDWVARHSAVTPVSRDRRG